MSPYNHGAPQCAQFDVLILAAGRGTRLGRPFPKALTPLVGGGTILDRQLEAIGSVFGRAARVSVVVGYGKELIMDSVPSVTFVVNDRYAHTDTAHSLLNGLRHSAPGGVLWMHGDLVFDPAMLAEMLPHLDSGESCACVSAESTRPTAVKYALDPDRLISRLSPAVREGLGEAVGIYYIAAADKAVLIDCLADCAGSDSAERGLGAAIGRGVRVHPVDVSDLSAVDVDVDADLRRADALPATRCATLPAQRSGDAPRPVRSADAVRG